MKHKNIINREISDVISERYIDYARYIILDRALPDLRDGLKPVQRRVLYSLFKLNLFHNKSHKKSAKVVGDVISKYHPHGDTSVYNSMIRMSQVWKLNIPLVNIQGNNGSIDGDSAAAMRYTEAKLEFIPEEYMLRLLNLPNIVDFIENFDDSEVEPSFLPSFFPNLLINGAIGISTGYATEIPPHNPIEIINALIFLAKNNNDDKKTTAKLLKIISGPDFPTGGKIEYIDKWSSIFKKGTGRFYIYSDYIISESENSKNYLLIFTSVPFNSNKPKILKQIDLIRINKKIQGIVDVRDESSNLDVKLVIEVNKSVKHKYLLNYLYKNTNIRQSYFCNYTAIINKRPITSGVDSILKNISLFHKAILKKKYNLEKHILENRLEILNGLIFAFQNIKKVIDIIINSNNKEEAKNHLISGLSINQNQAEAILKLQLYRLTNFDVGSLTNEKTESEKKLSLIIETLNKSEKFNEALCKIYELQKNKISPVRRTEVNFHNEEIDLSASNEGLGVSREKLYFFYFNNGNVLLQKDISSIINKLNEKKFANLFLSFSSKSRFDGNTLLITQKGTCLLFPNHKLKDRGFIHLNNYFKLDLYNNDIIHGFNFLNQKELIDSNQCFLIITKKGQIKIINSESISKLTTNRQTKFINLKEGDEILKIWTLKKDELEKVILISKLGYVNTANIKDIQPSSVRSGTIRVSKIKPLDEFIYVSLVNDEVGKEITILANNWKNKIINSNEFISATTNSFGKKIIPGNKHFILLAVDKNSDFLNYFILNNNLHFFLTKDYSKNIQNIKKDNKIISFRDSISSFYFKYNI